MGHVTFAEIYGHEKGVKEGLEKGVKEGLEKGVKEGLEKGVKEALHEALLAKFPQEGAELAAEFEGEQGTERLKYLLRCAVLALSPADFRLRVSTPS